MEILAHEKVRGSEKLQPEKAQERSAGLEGGGGGDEAHTQELEYRKDSISKYPRTVVYSDIAVPGTVLYQMYPTVLYNCTVLYQYNQVTRYCNLNPGTVL